MTEPEDKRKRETTVENDYKESDDEDDTDDDGPENSQENDDGKKLNHGSVKFKYRKGPCISRIHR